MPPYSNLPKLLRPIHPPHRPDHHDHSGHVHPYPRPSIYITSVAMTLLSVYISILVGLAIFTTWRISRKQPDSTFTTRNDAALRFGGGAGGVRRAGWQQKGIEKSRVVVREVDGSGGGSGSGSGGVIPNTHLSHEDLDDTEETALLGGGGYENLSYGRTESREPESYDGDGREPIEPWQSERRGGEEGPDKEMVGGKTRFSIGNQSLREPAPEGQSEGNNMKVLEGLQRAVEESR